MSAQPHESRCGHCGENGKVYVPVVMAGVRSVSVVACNCPAGRTFDPKPSETPCPGSVGDQSPTEGDNA